MDTNFYLCSIGVRIRGVPLCIQLVKSVLIQPTLIISLICYVRIARNEKCEAPLTVAKLPNAAWVGYVCRLPTTEGIY